MGPTRSRLLSYSSLGVGVLLLPLSFVTGRPLGDEYCVFSPSSGDDIHQRIYDMIEIYPPAYSARIDWSTLMVHFDTGCGIGHQTLLFSLAGMAFLLVGVGLYYRVRS